MVQFLSETTVVIATIFPLSIPSPNDKFLDHKPMVMQEYVSPTMNYDPFQNYQNNQIQKLIDSILIDQIRNETIYEHE